MFTFRDIIGHKTIKEHLQQGIRNRQVSHAYIFEGDDGVGKLMTAKTFAAALQCKEGGDEPCGHCISCLQMLSGNQPDVAYITHEKAKIGVDDIREGLCTPITIKPYAGPYRIFIVDEAEKMNEQAQNALLKTLEEPPEYGIIILLTNNRDAFLQTILSRAVTLAFLPVADSELVPYLMREAQIPDYRARLAAAFAGGSPGKALACADSEEFQKRRDTAVGLMQNLPDMSDERMAVSAKSLAAKKEELEDGTAGKQDTKKDIPPTKIFVYSGRALTLCPEAVSKAFADFTAMAGKLQEPDEAGGEPFTIKTLYVPYSDYLLLGALGYSKTFEALPVDAQKANLYLDDFAVNTVSIQELNLLATSDKPVKMFLSDPTAAEKCKALAGYISKFDSTANVEDNAAIKIFADLKAAEETALQQLEAACKSFLESFKKHLDNKDFAKGEELFMKEDSGETEEQKDNNSEEQNKEQTENSNESAEGTQSEESSEASGDTSVEEGQQ